MLGPPSLTYPAWSVRYPGCYPRPRAGNGWYVHATEDVKDLYTREGPFATVYLDGSRNTESGTHEVELRWRGLRGELAERGADEATLGVLEAAALDPDAPGRHGRILVAAGGQLLLDEPLHEVPATSTAAWDALPDVLPYLAERGNDIPHVVVVADRTGADIDVVLGEHTVVSQKLQGEDQHPIHKTRRNQWDERHFQNRVDNAWGENALDVAHAVVRHVEDVSAELVVVAGEERATALLSGDLQKLLPPGVAVAHVDAGGRAAGASAEALHEAVRDEVRKLVWRRRRELLEHLQQNLGRERFAAAGVRDVIDALRKAQADTVVLSDDRSSPLTAWIGPDPLQVATSAEELRDMGVAEPEQVRLDAALVRAVTGSGARLEVTPNGHQYLPEGIAALLRYDDA